MASTKQSGSSQTSGLTTTDYPSWLTQALTGSTVKGSANPIGGYGFTQDQIKQLQDRGVTVGDLQNMGLGGNPQAGVQPGASQNQLQNATMLKLMLAQPQNQAPPPPAPTFASPNPTIQLKPTAPLPVQPTQPPVQPGQPFAQIPQQVPQQVSDQAATGNVLNPIPVVLRQYQSGGLVMPSQNQQPGFYGNQYPIYAINAQGGPTGQPSYASPIDLGQLLGAAALGMPPIINPTPSGTPSSKSGVAQVGGAMVGTAVPQVAPSWDWVAHNAGLSSSDIAAFARQGLTPNDVAQKFNVSAGGLTGPWTTNPGVFARATPATPTAPLALNPQTPATAVPYAPGQAFATPPAAPSYTLGATMPQTSVPAAQTPWLAQGGRGGGGLPSAWGIPPAASTAPVQGALPQGFLQAHTSALANAGMALYSHFGGDPNSASPADIANFHSQLTTGVKKMATGGLVPGRGNEDTVPALLTPGEYVIPKQQVAQLVAGGALKMQSGGLVQDPDPDPNEPPEARRQSLVASQPSSSSSAQSSSLQVPEGRNLSSGLAQAAQTYGNSLSRIGTNAYQAPAGSSAMTVGQLGSGPMPGAGQTMSLGKLPPTTGLSSAGAQSALGGVASGLNQAAQAIASSAQPWQVQQSAIPDPSQLPKYQIPTLQPVRVT